MDRRAFVLQAAALGLAGPAAAQEYRPTDRLAPGPLVISTARRTAFDPARHGFQFANDFSNNAVPELDIRTDGLCGGMAYAALDYFNTPSIPMPTQPYMPIDGLPLRQYLYDRQNDSTMSNVDKWGELMLNPFGTRNEDFWKWGVELTPGSRINELKRFIDARIPVALGLRGCDERCAGDHQVVAIGYDLGNYNGDPNSATVRAIRIYIYDPNFPNRTMTLTPFPEARQFHYLEDHSQRWRTWFVNANYQRKNPPRVVQPARELIVKLFTGGDDLRGGQDNLDITLVLRGGRTVRFDNVNLGRRWVGNSEADVSLPLPDAVAVNQIAGVTLTKAASGGEGGDNWNLDAIVVWSQERGVIRELLFQSSGGEGEPTPPLFRFTGTRKIKVFLFR